MGRLTTLWLASMPCVRRCWLGCPWSHAAALAFPAQEAQSTLLLKKEQDMRIVDDALEYMKQEYRARMEVREPATRTGTRASHVALPPPQEVHAKEAQLAADKKEMEAMVERFRDFIQDNDAKRSRARMKQEAEEEVCAKLGLELDALAAQLEEQQGLRESLEGELGRLERYAAYMDSVVAFRHEEYAETASIQQRWRMLADFHDTNAVAISGTQREADELRQQVVELRQRTEDRVLALSSTVQGHTERLTALQTAVSEREAAADAEAAERGGKAKDSRMVVTSIRNMFNRCKATAPSSFSLALSPTAGRAGAPPPTAEDKLVANLALISKRLVEMQRLVDDYPAWQAATDRAAAERAEERRRAAQSDAQARGSRSSTGTLQATHGRRAPGQRSTTAMGRTASQASLQSTGRLAPGQAAASTRSPARRGLGQLSTSRLEGGAAVPTSQPGVFTVHIAAAGAGGLSPSGSGSLSGNLSSAHLQSSSTL